MRIRLIRTAFITILCAGLTQPGLLFPLETPAKERDKIRDDVWTANEIVVTASRTGMRYMDVPADVTVIDEGKLTQPGNKNIQDGLSSTAGVKNSMRNENPTFSTMELRGFDGNLTSGTNVLILLDGIPQRRLSFGGPYLGALPYDAITRMELVKGPAASLYGRDALAGVLQLFSSPGSAVLKAKAVASYEFVTGTEKAVLRATGPLGSGGSTFAVTGSLLRTEGWQTGTESVKGDVYARINLLLGERDELTVIGGAHRGTEDVPSPVFIDNDGDRLYGMARDANLAVPGQNSLESTEYRAGLIWNHVFNESFRIKAVTAYWDGLTEWKVGRPGDRNQDAGNSLVYAMTDNRSMDEYNVFNEIETQLKYGSGNVMRGTLVAGASYEYQYYSLTQTKIGTIPGDIKKAFPSTWRIPCIPINRYGSTGIPRTATQASAITACSCATRPSSSTDSWRLPGSGTTRMNGVRKRTPAASKPR